VFWRKPVKITLCLPNLFSWSLVFFFRNEIRFYPTNSPARISRWFMGIRWLALAWKLPLGIFQQRKELELLGSWKRWEFLFLEPVHRTVAKF